MKFARFLFAFALLALPVIASTPTPDVDAIIARLGKNAEDNGQAEARNAFGYNRTSRVDYLRDDQNLKRQVTRLYRVTPENGRPVTRLISVNGKPATAEQQKRRSSARETGDKSRTLTLSRELLSRYAFSFTGMEQVEGRPAWVLRFKPKAGQSSDGFFEKMLNAMTGILWIDVEECQLAKAEIFLAKKISFFGGFAGAIERLDLTVVQRRLESNVWLSEAAFIDFAGRKLFSPIRFRCYETCADFQKVPIPAQSGQKQRFN